MALMSAMATLFAALFVCLGVDKVGEGADGASAWGPAGVGHHRAAAPFTPVNKPVARYSCPYDGNDCGYFPHLSPAVLTVPPPAAPLASGVPHPRVEPTPPAGRLPRPGARARAPDLHVLQVLRT
ncbi:hypothetical protein [Streptomyces liangshanensis]|uniref:hypothetical protein n=1 Tax=Streptomyces liangshanensis TaxID=2717324 RepID=UPI0036DA9980